MGTGFRAGFTRPTGEVELWLAWESGYTLLLPGAIRFPWRSGLFFGFLWDWARRTTRGSEPTASISQRGFERNRDASCHRTSAENSLASTAERILRSWNESTRADPCLRRRRFHPACHLL